MATRRYAHALVSHKDIKFDQWMDEIRAQNEGAVPKNHVNRVANVILRKADPKQYLLSHATIVASVDTYAPKNAKLGRQTNRGVQIDVRYPDFRIKPENHDIINNNGDAWERSLLLATYRTFIGAPNYLEHIQLPELSKGFIIDAISRDLGQTCYIDILVGTDRKHGKLVTDILSGELSALSMGCISLFTICTKCGNIAADDSQLCPCVQYEGKGNPFADENGVQHPIAELIGHVTVPNSNQFIEASWVKNPAFRGAVRRNFLNADTAVVASKIGEAARIYEIRQTESHPDELKRAASMRRRAQGEDEMPDAGSQGQSGGQGDAGAQGQSGSQGDAGGQGQSGGQGDLGGLDLGQGGQGGGDSGLGDLGGLSGGGGGGGSSGGGQSQGQGQGQGQGKDQGQGGGIDKMLEDAQRMIVQNLVKALSEKLAPKPADVKSVVSSPDWESTGGNDNLVRASQEFSRKLRKTFSSQKLIRWAEDAYRTVHQGGRKSIATSNLTMRDLIVLSWIEDRVNGRNYPSNLYKVAMSVGAASAYPSTKSFVAACDMKLGRASSDAEKKFFIWKGKIASLAEF